MTQFDRMTQIVFAALLLLGAFAAYRYGKCYKCWRIGTTCQQINSYSGDTFYRYGCSKHPVEKPAWQPDTRTE